MNLTQSTEVNPAVGYAAKVLRFLRVTENDIRGKLRKFKYYDFVGNAAVLETVLSMSIQNSYNYKNKCKYSMLILFRKMLRIRKPRSDR